MLSLVIGLLVGLGIILAASRYLMSLRRELRLRMKAVPKGKTLVLSRRDIGPIIGTDLVVEFEKLPDDEADNAKSEDTLDEAGG
jgi:hypothetical protein